jgi:phage gp36-like protein
MSYVDQAGMIQRFSDSEMLAIADRDQDEVIDSALITQAIQDASDEIDSYLATRYATPIAAPVPGLVARLCADIARYRLYDDNPLEEVTVRYKAAVAQLKALADGKAQLPGVALTDSGVGALHYAASRDDSDRVFTHDTLANF